MSKIILIILASGSALAAFLFYESYYGKLFLVLFTIAIILFAFFYKHWKLRQFPTVTDEKFFQLFKQQFDFIDQDILKERRRISKYLGVPYNKISPTDEFEKLKKYSNFFRNSDIGLNDIENVMSELIKKNGVYKKYIIPDTIGELIRDTLYHKNQ